MTRLYHCQNRACDVSFPERKKYHSEECRAAAREKTKERITVRCPCGVVETVERRPFGPRPTFCSGCRDKRQAAYSRDSHKRRRAATIILVQCPCGAKEKRRWAGSGTRPNRCTECQKERDRECHRRWLDGRRPSLTSEEAIDMASLAEELAASRLRNACAVDELKRQVRLLARDLGVVPPSEETRRAA